jgi:hypothetical protein
VASLYISYYMLMKFIIVNPSFCLFNLSTSWSLNIYNGFSLSSTFFKMAFKVAVYCVIIHMITSSYLNNKIHSFIQFKYFCYDSFCLYVFFCQFLDLSSVLKEYNKRQAFSDQCSNARFSVFLLPCVILVDVWFLYGDVRYKRLTIPRSLPTLQCGANTWKIRAKLAHEILLVFAVPFFVL